MTIYVGDADLGLGLDNYLKPEAQRIRDGYVAQDRRLPRDRAAGSPRTARATAQMVLAIETRVAKKKLTPLEKRDPAKRFVPMPYARREAAADPTSTSTPTSGRWVCPPAAKSWSSAGRGAARAQRDPGRVCRRSRPAPYVQFELLRQMAPYLTPAFDAPRRGVRRRALRQGRDAAARQAGRQGDARAARTSAVAALRREVHDARVAARGRGDGRAREGAVPRAHRAQRLAVAGDAGAGAGQARQDRDPGRLPGEVDRLHAA